MYAPKYRLEAIETIGRKILLEYDRTLLEGPPQAIPIEMIIETKFNLTLEYHMGERSPNTQWGQRTSTTPPPPVIC